MQTEKEQTQVKWFATIGPHNTIVKGSCEVESLPMAFKLKGDAPHVCKLLFGNAKRVRRTVAPPFAFCESESDALHALSDAIQKQREAYAAAIENCDVLLKLFANRGVPA